MGRQWPRSADDDDADDADDDDSDDADAQQNRFAWETI